MQQSGRAQVFSVLIYEHAIDEVELLTYFGMHSNAYNGRWEYRIP